MNGSVLTLCARFIVSASRRPDSYRAFRSAAALQRTQSLRRDLKLARYSFVGALVCILLVAARAQAQRQGERPVRDVVQELSRIDTNRAVDLQRIKGNKPDDGRQAILKQVSDDFRELQSLNNKMMATALSQPDLDYKYISRTVGEIGKKATRLKSNLALPKSEEKEEPTKPSGEISTTQDFKAGLLLLDRSVMSFVTNPIFKNKNVIELRMANQATRDLDAVIEMSNRLKKVSAKLRKD